MVKKGQILGPRPEVNRDGTPRKRPGRAVPRDDLRSERLVLRIHPDLMEIIATRSREKGVSRSAYVESVVLGWANSDPRNPRVDGIGKFDPKAPSPGAAAEADHLKFAERWARFVHVSELILGTPPKREWFEQDPNEFWPDGSGDGARFDEPNEDDEEATPTPPLPAWSQFRKKAAEGGGGSDPSGS